MVLTILYYSFFKIDIYPIKRYLHLYFRNPDDSNGGKLVLGGSDKNLYTGEMNYIPLSQTTYWQVNMDG